MPTTEGREIALLSHTFLVALGQKEVDRVVQVGSLIEVSLRRAGEETQPTLCEFTLVLLRDKPILLMHDAVVRQHLDCLMPSRVHRLVFGRGYGKQLR